MDSGNHYVAQVKRNQPSLHTEIERVILQEHPLEEWFQEEKGHGRHSRWYVSVYNARQSEKVDQWTGLSRFIHVHKVCKQTKTGKHSHSNRFYITDLASTQAALYGLGIRAHWGIENRLHWVKDVRHNEDKNRIKTNNGPINCAIISSMAINFHRNQGHQSILDAQVKAQANTRKIMAMIKT